MAMRVGIGFFLVLILLLQGRLWVSHDGFREVARLEGLIRQQQDENARMAERNQRLEAEVHDVKAGDAGVEERARSDLGLIGANETFYIFGEPQPQG